MTPYMVSRIKVSEHFLIHLAVCLHFTLFTKSKKLPLLKLITFENALFEAQFQTFSFHEEVMFSS